METPTVYRTIKSLGSEGRVREKANLTSHHSVYFEYWMKELFFCDYSAQIYCERMSISFSRKAWEIACKKAHLFVCMNIDRYEYMTNLRYLFMKDPVDLVVKLMNLKPLE